ncbi:3-dehydroquinate synthase [Metabacillus malikii]|uniref:3-dehydroquinate synthase n=1 Tax=Metabacillus malikii TaxID=1504265 RepID=A0ABT9ZAW6_9BACI|nr:3-dehydroquinate synthase [Metabacillus malikii]MDQ0228753.1 3-dehydroquinate synthase [Metabacillus malikii]
MESIVVNTSVDTYPVIVGNNAKSEIPNIIESLSPSKILIVTDTAVDSLYGEELFTILAAKWPTFKFVIKSGEASKSFESFYELHTYALEQELDRKSVIIAFGGGVVGDLTGFVAATYMRGIPFIQVPTTLLAHDSAVGGKVAINHPEGKNMIGAFYQPKAVVYDTSYLKSLPESELRSGFAEVIKHSLIRSNSLYQFLYKEIKLLKHLSTEHLQKVILEGIQIKADVVSKDEKELGLRAILNFGHTLGHAVEAEAGYGKLSHGDSIAIGMIFATWLSNKKINANLPYKQLKTWFSSLGFPTVIPSEYKTEQLISRMKKDKKAKSNQITMILLEQIGNTSMVKFTEQELLALLDEWRAIERGDKLD